MSNAALPELDASREAKLKTYEALLHKWQKAVNLVSPGTLPDSWNRHFVDSLQVVPLVPAAAKTLYDLGSGAGFPGIVLAMMLPGLAVTPVESDQKKCTFMLAVSRETKTPLTVHCARIEHAAESLPAPDVVSARALANLSELLRLIRPWVEKNPDLVCLFPKGAQYAAEIKEAQALARFEVVEKVSVTDSAARILLLRNIVFI